MNKYTHFRVLKRPNSNKYLLELVKKADHQNTDDVLDGIVTEETEIYTGSKWSNERDDYVYFDYIGDAIAKGEQLTSPMQSLEVVYNSQDNEQPKLKLVGIKQDLPDSFWQSIKPIKQSPNN